MAAAVSADPGMALRIHTREERGIDPDELPSPVLAGAASLLAFSLGALVPLLPYLLGVPVLAATLVITAVALINGRDGRRPAHRAASPAVGPAAARAGKPGRRSPLAYVRHRS